MFPKWLGPFFIALYIIIDSRLVLDGKLTLGPWAFRGTPRPIILASMAVLGYTLYPSIPHFQTYPMLKITEA